ncbi:autotransporter outer membrane beta-barrel domain-containing protein [Candidatus Tisiphia endosymbiont of Nemotelus uliginosus]|uniref:autotransporter outer membrane beta-barrel domain-containing protein n=1 Tax=Candidatus Tisiphia endosymbiont of Nemotelus uliginosus TaxID=3077926 RepID=UPI0035C8D1EB
MLVKSYKLGLRARVLLWVSMMMSLTYASEARAMDSFSSGTDVSITVNNKEEKISQTQTTLKKLEDKLKALSVQQHPLQYVKEYTASLYNDLEQLNKKLGIAKYQSQHSAPYREIYLSPQQQVEQTLANLHQEFESIMTQQTICQKKLSIIHSIKEGNVPAVMTVEEQQYYEQYKHDPSQFDIELLEQQVQQYEHQKEELIRTEQLITNDEYLPQEEQQAVNNAPIYGDLSIVDNSIIKNIQAEYEAVTKELKEKESLLSQYEALDKEQQQTVRKIKKKQKIIRKLYNISDPRLADREKLARPTIPTISITHDPESPDLSFDELPQKLEFNDTSSISKPPSDLAASESSKELEGDFSLKAPSYLSVGENLNLDSSFNGNKLDVHQGSSLDSQDSSAQTSLLSSAPLSSTPNKNKDTLHPFQNSGLAEPILSPIKGITLAQELKETGNIFSATLQSIVQTNADMDLGGHISEQAKKITDIEEEVNEPLQRDDPLRESNLNDVVTNVNNVTSPSATLLPPSMQGESEPSHVQIIANNTTDPIRAPQLTASAFPMRQSTDIIDSNELSHRIINASNTLLLGRITQLVNNMLINNIVDHRINLVNIVAAGDNENANIQKGLWISSLYGANRFSTLQTMHSYQGSNYGAIIGFDAELTDRKEFFGIAYHTMHFRFKLNDRNNKKILMRNHGVTLYHHKECSNAWSIHSILTAVRNYIINKSVCNIAHVQSDCRSKYNNTLYNAGTKINYKIFTPTIVIMPYIGMRYGYYQTGPYIESNIRTYRFSIAANKDSGLTGIIGTKVITPSLYSTNSGLLKLILHGSIEQNFFNKNKTVHSKVTYINNNTHQVINVPKLPKVSYNIGASILYEKNNIKLFTQYNYYVGKKYYSHQGAIIFKFMF